MSVTVNNGPSADEIGRRLDTLSADVRTGFEGVNLRLDKYVLGEVHQLHVNNTHRRIDDLNQELDELRKDRAAATWRIFTAALGALSLVTSITVGVLALVIK